MVLIHWGLCVIINYGLLHLFGFPPVVETYKMYISYIQVNINCFDNFEVKLWLVKVKLQ